jgi:hypothetical protein
MMLQRTIVIGNIAPAARVVLDRRIAEERMIALQPPFEQPDWFYEIRDLGFVPNAFVMDATGEVPRRWCKADEIDWSLAVAVRFETSWGKAIDLEELDDDEDYG